MPAFAQRCREYQEKVEAALFDREKKVLNEETCERVDWEGVRITTLGTGASLPSRYRNGIVRIYIFIDFLAHYYK